MDKQDLSWVETVDDITSDNIPCSREDFVRAMKILNNSESEADAFLSGEGDENIKRILLIALSIAKKHNIVLWTPETSEKILASLENSNFLVMLWIAQYVRQKIDGIIWAAPANKLLAAINTIQKDYESINKLSIYLVLFLWQLKQQRNNMTKLAKYSGTTTAAITGTAKRLVELWYVERKYDPKDRRVIFLSLTKKGQNLLSIIEAELTK